MDNQSISIFGNKIFLEIIKEIKLFSKYVIKHYDNLDFCISDAKKENQVLVFFVNKIANKSIEKLNLNELSMGMSSDFDKAVLNGSTYLRLGTAIMGDRKFNK